MICGIYDRIADLKDTHLLKDTLKNVTYQTFEGGHGTFMWAKNANLIEEMIVPILNLE